MTPSPLTFGSLFAGIGGWDLGLEAVGMECKWQVEIDPFCLSVLERHWPDVPKYQDVFRVSGSTLEAVDAICGGFPCQPFSSAGKRQGTSDPRWLWPEYARLVGEIRPKYVLVENVPGLYSKGGAEVAADLATLGYSYQWGSLSATTVGAPHKRERFFLVAYPNRNGLGGAGIYESKRTSVLLSPRSSRSRGDTTRTRSPKRRTVAFGGRGKRWGTYLAITRRKYESTWETDPANLPESRVGRVVDGIPERVERIKALGNALIPQMAEVIGRIVIDMEMSK